MSRARLAAVTLLPLFLLLPATRAHATTPTNKAPTLTNTTSRTTRISPHSRCATNLTATQLNRFFSTPQGSYRGADYQRAYPLPDGRVLWLFQDFIFRSSTGRDVLLHNAGMIQNGNCFTTLHAGTRANPRSWLLWDIETPYRTWHWPLGGEVTKDGRTLQVIMAEMAEEGPRYLSKTRPRRTILVDIRLSDLLVTGYRELSRDPALFGFSVTSDRDWTYLYSHCYRQFGWGPLGHDWSCTGNTLLARTPRGNLDSTLQYWDGQTWTWNRAAATPVINNLVTWSGVNPVQVMFDGTLFRMIVKTDDWWGDKVKAFWAPNPHGPWTQTHEITHPVKTGPHCQPSGCNTYFGSWVPWRDPSNGRLIWSISHNRWDGHLSPAYRPTFHNL